MLLYSGTPTGRDFLALELFDGQVRYVYDVGGGARTLRVSLRYSVSNNRWHQVAVIRSTLTQVPLRLSVLVYLSVCLSVCQSVEIRSLEG